MRKSLSVLIALLVIASLLLAACGNTEDTPTPKPAADNTGASTDPEPTDTPEPKDEPVEKVTIRWFVGLGAGSEPENIPLQEEMVAQFNASQDRIELVAEYVDYEQAPDVLSTQIAGGNPPDLIGPVGQSGVNALEGLFLDLEPYLGEFTWDDFEQDILDAYRLEGQGFVGIPIAVYPSSIFYNRDLFDEAGLEYPPHKFGEPYADGDPWTVEKLEELALLLTVDGNGSDATSSDFDPEDIVQFGFHVVWSDGLRTDAAALFGPGAVVDENGNAMLPDRWREGIKWYYDAIHQKHFYPTFTQETSDLLGNDNTFNSGHVAMNHSHLWYTCCVEDLDNWDMAVVPEYDDEGHVMSKLHADTFRILKSSEHPEEAVEVLRWMTGEAAPEFLQIYGGFPARLSQQSPFIDDLNERFPHGVDWQVVLDSLAYPDIPNHESNMPNYSKAFDRMFDFHSSMASDPNLDMDAELDKLLEDLQVIFDEVK